MSRKKLTAKTADRFDLYERSVQCPEADIPFLERVFQDHNGRSPLSLREDFCGSALLCAEWVKSLDGRTAEGIDLSEEVLTWGNEHNVQPLGAKADRVQLLQQDVMTPKTPLVDIQCAFNFSYCTFKERKTLLKYFQGVHASLKDDGLFFLDIHGGTESMELLEEENEKDGFSYIWEQGEYDPMHAHRVSWIHFKFKDRSKIKRAFTYDWRIWTIPELRDLLDDAGFRLTEVYWEGTDPDDEEEGNGVYERVEKGDNDPSFISYVVGIK